MTKRQYIISSFIISLAGTLFAGYLAGVKMFSGSCAFNEPCPYFLGQPACLFGFVMFLAMFLSSAWSLRQADRIPTAARINTAVALLGMFFAGYYSFGELSIMVYAPDEAPAYGMGLPTCVYGLVFYVIMFALSLRAVLKGNDRPTGPEAGPPAASDTGQPDDEKPAGESGQG
ncbi:hypothetical protein AMJ57_04700 [Parcubacteria bacterium SG8_24]|nr:MAG: hypothetical protein AMJ57_04700 [Parcubacteria bacterium SG8_24]